jgi:hypothetical protein
MKKEIDYEEIKRTALASIIYPELLFGKNGIITEMADFDVVFKDYLKKKKQAEDIRNMCRQRLDSV